MSGFCPSCRVPNNAEHEASSFHAYNALLLSQGKMPVSQQHHSAMEAAQRANGQTVATAATTVQGGVGVTHNVKGWHWQNFPFNNFFFPTLKTQVQQICNAAHPMQQDAIVKLRVSEITGEAYLNNRKGKVTPGFMIDVKLDIRCKINDDMTLLFTALVPDLESSDIDDASITSIKYDSEKSTGNPNKDYKDAMQKTIKGMQKLFIQALKVSFKEMETFAKDPKQDYDIPATPVPDFD